MKKNYITVVFSNNKRDVTITTTILMVITGDKDTYYQSDDKYKNQVFVNTKCSGFRYWLAKRFINKYVPGICGFNCM